ncbi:bifunctional DNA primase/polymerase [Streptomyces sp. 3N207]|uniref:bifunctional DNA primase/polymerase n=1 Tax=Streptomyces sp. 3N207 TaxID=3457417 RepID=UPI003FD32E6D
MARWCAAQGWPVHPLTPGRKTPTANCPDCRRHKHAPHSCSCIPAGRPCHGFHAATTDPDRIDTWWSTTPAAGVGIACGPANLVVIDIDAHPAPVPGRSSLLPGITIDDSVQLDGLATGFDTLALLAAYRRQPDPAEDTATLRVRTPSGGRHIWYTNPHPELKLRCSTGSSPKVALAWQVDVRATGGYIIAPTTPTHDGVYAPLGTARHPAPLPDWLAAELVRTGHLITAPPPRPPAPRRRTRQSATPGTVDRILEPLIDQVAQCAAAPEGMGFTGKLNRAAFTAGGLTASGALTEADARQALAAAAQQARPHQMARNDRIITDGLHAGQARPLYLRGRS